MCDNIVIVMKHLSTKKTNNITANVTTTALINYHSKKSKALLYFDHVTIDSCWFMMLSDKILSKTFITTPQIIKKISIDSIN